MAKFEQQMEILEETLRLHRKRITKQYKKIDVLQKELTGAKEKYTSCLEGIRELQAALRAEHVQTEKLSAALSCEKVAYSDLQRRYVLLEEEDTKWRNRWTSMLEVMKESKTAWSGWMEVGVSPTKVSESLSISNTTRVSPPPISILDPPRHTSSSRPVTPLWTSVPSPKHAGINGESDRCVGISKGFSTLLTGDTSGQVQWDFGAKDKGSKGMTEVRREIEERARDREELRQEMERARLRDHDMHQQDQEGEGRERGEWGEGRKDKDLITGNKSDILRKFEREQMSFRQEMEALKLIFGRQSTQDLQQFS
jgi:hypothetical protein